MHKLTRLPHLLPCRNSEIKTKLQYNWNTTFITKKSKQTVFKPSDLCVVEIIFHFSKQFAVMTAIYQAKEWIKTLTAKFLLCIKYSVPQPYARSSANHITVTFKHSTTLYTLLVKFGVIEISFENSRSLTDRPQKPRTPLKL